MCSFNSGYKPFTTYWFRWYLVPRHWISPVKHFWQRGRRGWADCDLWNLDTFLATVISETVTKSSESSSYPSGNTTQEEWISTLLEISEGFKLYLQEDTKLDQKKFNKSFKLLKDNFKYLWD